MDDTKRGDILVVVSTGPAFTINPSNILFF